MFPSKGSAFFVLCSDITYHFTESCFHVLKYKLVFSHFFFQKNSKDSNKEPSAPFHQKPPMKGREIKGRRGSAERKVAGNQRPTEVRVWYAGEEEEAAMGHSPAPYRKTLSGTFSEVCFTV